MADSGYGSIEGVDPEKLKELEKCVGDGDLDATKDKLSKLLGPEKLKELEKCVGDGDKDKLSKLSGANVDDGKLKELQKCLGNGDMGAFKDTLSKVSGLNFDGYTERILIRAKVYSRLIAVALGLTPQDIRVTKEVTPEQDSRKKYSVKPQDIGKIEVKKVSVEFVDRGRLSVLRDSRVDEGRVVLRYLLKEALEEDDEVMTVLFCDLNIFKKYPVPYFDGCEVNTIEQVHSLWLTRGVLEDCYFGRLIKPIVDMVKDASSITDEKFIQAKLMVCRHLHQRRLKAGARLFWLVTREREAHKMVGDLVKEIFNTKAAADDNNWVFKDSFFNLWDKYWHNLDLVSNITDQVRDGNGQSICVGLISSPDHTDGNLLCWAARRNYPDLIWCVMQAYKPPSKSDTGYNDSKEFERIFAWKMALWCSTRQGEFCRVIRELSIPQWTKSIDFSDYPTGWLPPFHLAAIFGDSDRMEILCQNLFKVQSRANKKDYLGRTPFDYAMQFQSKSSREIKLNCFAESSKKDKDCKPPAFEDVIKKLLPMDGVGERLKELYDMYIHQANTVLIGSALIASVTFAGWLQPPLGYREYFQFTRPGPSTANGNIYYESYVAIEGHPGIEVFVVCNTLSFFLAIATVLVGAEATLFVHDSDEKTSALIRMRKSIKWMIGFFISSMICIMAAFIFTILPPIQRLEWSMIISLGVGGGICIIPLCWIFWSLNQDQIMSFIKTQPLYRHVIKLTKSSSSKEKIHLCEKTDKCDKSLIDSKKVKKMELEHVDFQGGRT